MHPTNLHTSPRKSALPTRRQFLQGSAAALSGLALSSCGWTLGGSASESEEPEASSLASPKASSDKLYIYTWADYTDSDLVESFKTKTGIQAIVDVFDSNEVMLAKIQAGGGGAYSIIYPSDYMVARMIELKLLNSLDHSRLKGLQNLFEKFQNPTYDPGNRYSVPFTYGTTGLVYNSKRFSSAPDDWDYLWEHQEELSRKMTLFNDVREVMGAGLRMLGYSYNTQDSGKLEEAYQKLAQLKPALVNFTTDGWRDLILAGDLNLAMGFSSDALTVAEEDPNIKFAIPRSGTSLFSDAMVIPKSAPNVNGAYKWLNFLLQPEVVAPVVERLNFSTPNRAAFALLPKELQENPSLFPPESVLEKCEGIAPLDSAKEKEFARYWIKLRSV